MAKIFILSLLLVAVLPFSHQNAIPEEEGGETQAMEGVSKDPNDIEFYLYSNPAKPTEGTLLKLNDLSSIVNSKYDPSKRLIIYSSGFLQNHTTDQAVKDAYLSAGFASSANIIVVNWGKLSGNRAPFPATGVELYVIRLYAAAKDNVNIVGRRVQEFLTFLDNNGQLGAGTQNVHLVGQSLGAHVSGMVGLYFRQVSGKDIGRITGTDPAGPLYQGVLKSVRLDASDATFVDIIHTNAGGYGYNGNIGTVDFLVNGGKAPQPGCGDGTDDFCSHNLAVVYYAKSILDTSIRGFNNNGEIQFGEYVPPTASGEYTVEISPEY